MGARPLARVIQTEVRDPLTDEILFGQLEHGGTVTDPARRRKARLHIRVPPPPHRELARERPREL
jgi:ATP-dependent Clp protease ATP-binding subunit ClpA